MSLTKDLELLQNQLSYSGYIETHKEYDFDLFSTPSNHSFLVTLKSKMDILY